MTERKHIIVNVSFKYFNIILNNTNKRFEEDINNFLNIKLNVMRIALI